MAEIHLKNNFMHQLYFGSMVNNLLKNCWTEWQTVYTQIKHRILLRLISVW